MAILEVTNLYTKVTDLTVRGKGAIRDILGIPVPNHEFSAQYKAGFWDGKTHFFSLTTGKFPTGLLPKVMDALHRVGEKVVIRDSRKGFSYTLPESIDLLDKKLGTITLRDYQYDSVALALEAKRGVVNVATNGGKTEIACALIKSILPHLPKDKRIVFFVPSKEIFYQSQQRISERLGIKVGLIGDGVWDEQMVTVAMIATVAKYMKNTTNIPKNITPELYREKHKKTTKFLKSIYTFIGDEVHHASSSTWYDLFMKLDSAYYRFGLTGTIDEKNEINVMRLYGCTGDVVKRVSNKFLIENGYSAKPTINMLSIDCQPFEGDYAFARKYGIVENVERNERFVYKIQEKVNSGLRALVIVNETEHGNILTEMLEDLGVEVMFSHGERSTKYRKEALDSLRDGSLNCLIATTILDEGVDVAGINCLFLVAGGKSMRQILQRVGRGLRKKADGSGVEVYDALDLHNEYLAEHTLERYETYKDEGFDIVKVVD